MNFLIGGLDFINFNLYHFENYIHMPKNHGKVNKERKRVEAQERQAAYDKLSTTEKIAQLDKTFGKGLGAGKQRRRLALLLEQENQTSNYSGATINDISRKKIKK
jgi:hypothetical protein